MAKLNTCKTPTAFGTVDFHIGKSMHRYTKIWLYRNGNLHPKQIKQLSHGFSRFPNIVPFIQPYWIYSSRALFYAKEPGAAVKKRESMFYEMV